MSERRHYLCDFRLDGGRLFVVWYSNDKDGLVNFENGKIGAFSDEPGVREFCRSAGLLLIAEPLPVYDFDAVATWCARPSAAEIDHVTFLNAWNMFDDALPSQGGAHSIYELSSKGAGRIYDKLFFANNLPSVITEDAHYNPVWSQYEVDLLARLFQLGLADLRIRIGSINRQPQWP